MFLVPFKIDPGIHQSLLLDSVEQPFADEQGQVNFMAEQVDKDIKPVILNENRNLGYNDIRILTTRLINI